jgi:hypothetical protein
LSASEALWLAIAALGLYHGLNPAMGWPLAVANGMSERRGAAVFATLLPLGGGHFAAMAVALLPFAWLALYAEWSRGIRLAAGTIVLLFGVFLLVRRRHPRVLARIRPSRLAWWSFLSATAHGAGLMLLPFMLRLCEVPPAKDGDAHAKMMVALTQSTLATALSVAVVHTLAMMAAGLAMAWLVYRYLGLKFLRSAWLNLDLVWAASLVVAGLAGVVTAL